MNITAINSFVEDFALKRTDGIIAFNATISYLDKENVAKEIFSEVQVINIPNGKALYIIEFFRNGFNQPEMYSTTAFYFSYNEGKLGIRSMEHEQDILIVIDPGPLNNNA